MATARKDPTREGFKLSWFGAPNATTKESPHGRRNSSDLKTNERVFLVATTCQETRLSTRSPSTAHALCNGHPFPFEKMCPYPHRALDSTTYGFVLYNLSLHLHICLHTHLSFSDITSMYNTRSFVILGILYGGCLLHL